MPWGPLTVERHTELKAQGIDLRVFVRGEDVTDRCRYADDTPGREVAEFVLEVADGVEVSTVEVAYGDVQIRVRQVH